MASNGHRRRSEPRTATVNTTILKEERESFKLRNIFDAFTGLPRVVRLVWGTSRLLTLTMGMISLIRGFLPAVSVSISRLLIDAVIRAAFRTHNITPVLWIVGAQLLISIVQTLLGTVSNITQQLLQEKVSHRVQLMILEKANTLDLAFFENSEFYDKLRTAAEESNYKPSQMISQTFDLGRTLVTFFSMVFLLFQLAWWLALIAIAVPLPSFIANSRYGWIGYQRMRRQSPERRRMRYVNNILTTDTYNKEIKLFSLGRFFIHRYNELAEKFYDENKVVLVRRYLTSFFWSSLSTVANSAIYVYVAIQAVFGKITVGGLTMYTQTAMQVGQNFQGLLDGVASLYENNLFVSTLYEFLEYEPKIISPTTPQPFNPRTQIQGLEIEFRNVSFTYPGKDPETEAALRNVSFTIHAGEAIALVGRNGAGKTTIVKLLTRLYDPDEGEIFIGGRNIKEYDLKELRQEIGVIFQDYVAYQMNARENIGVGQIDDIEKLDLIKNAAQKSGASGVIGRLPDGYETMLGRWFKDGAQLSGGEWQKVALARAFMRDARIIVLDEPTSSLDAQAEYEVFARFRELTEGKTAIFISHRFSTVRLADRIFVIENGVIQESGSHVDLIKLNGRYAELFNIQAEAYR